MALMRTAKSCRSDAPMLASSLREEARATVSNKPGHRGEHEVSRKTIARGMPGDFRCDRGDYTRVFFIYTAGCGRIERPAFPAPSVTGGREIQVKLARKPRRDREAVFAERCCLKSEVDPSTSVMYGRPPLGKAFLVFRQTDRGAVMYTASR